MTQPRASRTGMRRAIVILPGAFTAGNLFFGIWGIVEASRGNFIAASWFVVISGIMDVIDGRVARVSRTGTAFGAEMDSLVDVISFGVAPAMLVYFHTFRSGEWAWLLSFIYVLAAVLRLARFNLEQAGKAKSSFFGLPSPAAGMTLATFYPFTHTPWFQQNLGGQFNLPLILAIITVCVALLMVSNVPYAVWPRIGVRSTAEIVGLAFTTAVLVALLTVPAYFFFPFMMAYILFGVGRALLLGLHERMPDRDVIQEERDPGSRDDTIPFIRKRRRSGGTGQP